MSPKKQHEVGTMAEFVGKFAAAHKVATVVDLGSGQGYLSRLLAFQHGLNVLGVDGDSAKRVGAHKMNAQFLKRSTQAPGKLSHTTLVVDSATLPQLQKAIADFNGTQAWLLCGLHTCGPLAYTTIDLFLKSDAKCLVSVACCYNRLTEEDFPSSEFLKARAPSTWAANPDGCFEFFKRHFYRALLQKLMVELGLITATQAPPTIGKLKKFSYSSFQTYAEAALTQLRYRVPSSEKLNSFYTQHLTGYRQLALVWTLQSALAPVVETLLILDRYLNIKERLGSSGSVTILPMFDLTLSPRCFALVAHKEA
ncbi:hypothetical protein L0F63_004623 [Massospora cicadina]|nr:hypothetical protein L0F63_004623 [Massospora cicadina]